MDYGKESIKLHEQHKGKLEIRSKVSIKTKDDLSIAYTPGVAYVCMEIAKDKSRVFDLTLKANSVAVVTDGTAVLGLGNIGPYASIPVMEGKAILFKEFADIDAFPLALDTKDIVATVKAIAPVFGGINLEDIKAPECFEIEAQLQDLGIPVMHDDQHGTAVVVLAALINALKVVNKSMSEVTIVISGAGAAGIASTKLLLSLTEKPKDIIVLDSQGAIYEGRQDLNKYKEELAKSTNKQSLKGTLEQVIKGADVFIGVSKGNILSQQAVATMAKDSIVFAMANPIPEIMPDKALAGGAAVVGTGRSDFPNQINNVLAFPGIFRGALDCRAKAITQDMKLAAAHALADYLKNPAKDNILPSTLDKNVAKAVADAVKKAAEPAKV
ncbi:MAG: malic enzyme-like NAD(P)-binding protein [Candidatus Woesearchaeota archaeon]